MNENKTILVGVPMSTFTRTIALGLHELGVPFEQIACLPKSEEAFKKGVNPFGHLPSLHIDGRSIFESSAIARYLETHHSSKHSLRPSSSDSVLIDELSSIAGDYLFRSIEFLCVKPRTAKEGEGVAEEEIAKALTSNSEQCDAVLSEVEKLIDANGPYLTGSEVTWADLFVYPVLADFKSIPVLSSQEGKSIRGGFPRLSKWMIEMEKRESVTKTFTDTIADQRIKNKRKLE